MRHIHTKCNCYLTCSFSFSTVIVVTNVTIALSDRSLLMFVLVYVRVFSLATAATGDIGLGITKKNIASLTVHLVTESGKSQCENFEISFARCGARDVDVAVRASRWL